MPFSEDTYEQSLIQLLEKLGYEHVYGPSIETRDYRTPLYEDILQAKIRELNPNVCEEAILDALYKLHNFDNGALVDKNEKFMDWLQNGIPVRYVENGEERSDICYLADYKNIDNNSFIVANQWTFIENANKRPDIIIFLNGLPVVIMELKSPARQETDASEAYTQLRNYMHDIPSMFIYNAFLVMSDLLISKAGTITSGEDRFMEWKSKDGVYTSERIADFTVFFEGMFRKDHFLDIIKNFILFSHESKQKVKILAGYHQYFAVKKAIERAEEATKTDGKGGVFWHTQGSGKSLSMVFYAKLLQSRIDEPTLVVITDRNDLDGQLFAQFAKCKDFLRQQPIQAESRQNLIDLLNGRQANGIFFTTIEKFTELDKPLSLRKNIIVMADEAHRSQYGLAEHISMRTNENGEQIAVRMVGFARKVRNALPNATYIGFTGTPISTKDKNTREIFGDYIDVYDMTQSVADGATRPVYYESRVIKLKLDSETISKIDDLYDEMSETAEEEVIYRSKKKLGQLEAVLGNPSTIDSLCRDIVEHYENNRKDLLTGKALIVAYSRPVAVAIWKKIVEELRPNWKGMVKVVMTSDNKDPEEWRSVDGVGENKIELANEFKDDESKFKIAIVVDMWLTGFDVPSLATMYVYKPMSGHNLMQAIARVNRVFEDKEGGLVVDYIGIASALKAAMREYTKRDQAEYGDMDILKKAYPVFQEKLQICGELLHGYDYSIFKTGTELQKAKCITGAVNFLVEPAKEETKDSYMKEALALHQALSLSSSLAKEEERDEASFFEAVRVLLVRLTNSGIGKKLSLNEINKQVSELLKQSVVSDGVINLFADKAVDFSLFDPKFIEEIGKMKEKNLAVELLKRLIKEQIIVFQRTNLVKSMKFSEIMQNLMNGYLNGMLTNEEVISELLAMARNITDAVKEGESLGLTPEELAFYDALTKPQAISDFYQNEELVNIAKELTETLRKNRTIDWQRRESARAKMRRLIKKLLHKYKYPPEEIPEAMETVMAQCELWADESFNN